MATRVLFVVFFGFIYTHTYIYITHITLCFVYLHVARAFVTVPHSCLEGCWSMSVSAMSGLHGAVMRFECQRAGVMAMPSTFGPSSTQAHLSWTSSQLLTRADRLKRARSSGVVEIHGITSQLASLWSW